VTVAVSQYIGAQNPAWPAERRLIRCDAGRGRDRDRLLLVLSGRFIIRFLFGGAEQDDWRPRGFICSRRPYLFRCSRCTPRPRA
jgi:hypothetical protein